MDVDEVDSVDILPSTPDPVVSVVPVPVIMNLSEIQILNNDDEIGWESVTKMEDNHYVDIPLKALTKKNDIKKEDNRICLPTYPIAELCDQRYKLNSGLDIDPAFRKRIYKEQKRQRSEIVEKRNRKIIEEEKKKLDFNDEEMEERLGSGEEPEFDIPIHDRDIDVFDDEC